MRLIQYSAMIMHALNIRDFYAIMPSKFNHDI